MDVTVIRATELTEDMRRSWLDIKASNPLLEGPCFHPDLVSTVGAHLPDVHVAVLSDRQGIFGFFPFCRQRTEAAPVEFCDFETVIRRSDRHIDMNVVLRRARLRSWRFDALVGYDHLGIDTARLHATRAARIDLASGLDHAANQHRIARESRRTERDIGPVRFVPRCTDPDVLGTLIRWKTSPHDRSAEWQRSTTAVLSHLCRSTDGPLSGELSALYAGDHLLAVHFGILADGILHGILFTFNPAFAKYSPGRMIVHHVVASGRAMGCHRLDLGPGNMSYKLEFATATSTVLRGDFWTDSLRNRVAATTIYRRAATTARRAVDKAVGIISGRSASRDGLDAAARKWRR